MQGRFKREGSAAGDAGQSDATDRGSSAGPAPGAEPARPAAGGKDQPSGKRSVGQGKDTPSGASPVRPISAGSRLALRNWRISTRLVSLIALPVAAATVMGALRIEQSLGNVDQLEDMQLLTDITQQATLLAAALQEERDRSAGPLVSGDNPDSDEVISSRERTDEAILAFSDARLQINSYDDSMRGVEATIHDIARRLNELSQVRNAAYDDPDYASQTVTQYSEVIEALLSLSQDMAQATNNSDMISSTRALAAFSSAKEHASIQRAVITAGLARAELPGGQAELSEADWRFGRTHLISEEVAIDNFAQIYGDNEQVRTLLSPLEGGIANIAAANDFAQRVFSAEEGIRTEERTYRNWYDQDRTKIEAMGNIERTLLFEMQEQARQLRDEAQREALLNGAIVLLVLGISLVGAFVVARSMVRSLRRLQDTATEVARTRLPEVVKQMSEAEPGDVDTSVESVGVHTRDEIGRVAQAFDDVHREAVRLAGEQALLRGNVNAMFTNLSRRSQGLIQRQLSLISELESREADPDQLSSLFKLDHLATRMRRNGENLLVLAGEEPGRRWTRPVPLVDVLRAAASEVEQYERIELSAVPKTDVAGRVVNDLVHLLAELLENATSFSSPQTKVKVTGHALPDGRVLVEIHDTGIGLSPEDLAEINDRLANPPTVDVSVSRRMGLFVVGRLSLRHGIRIQLRPSDSGGTTALVMLPADVAQGAGRPRPGGRAAGTASATLQRDTPPGRRPSLGKPEGGQQEPGLGGPPPARGVPGRPERPALPSRSHADARPGPGGPASPGGPGNFGTMDAPRPQGAPQEPQRAEAGPERQGHVPRQQPAHAQHSAPPAQQPAPPQPGPAAGRPSWATGDDTARIPAVGNDVDAPRGHDASSTGEYPLAEPPRQHADVERPQAPTPQAHARRAEAPAPRPDGRGQAGFPGAPDDGSVFGSPPPRHGQPGPQDTGEFPTGGYPAAHAPRPPEYPTGEYPARQDQRPGLPADDQRTSSWQRPRDELTAPLPAQEPLRPAERTPIFEEMESTWFGTRRAYPPPEAGPRPDETQTPTAPAAPQRAHDTAPPTARPDGPASAVPPSAQQPASNAGPGAWRASPNDERWRQAEQLRQPSAGGVTTSGLPKRVPRANLVAGAAQTQAQPAAQAGPQVSRRPDDVRGRLTNLRRGIQQGRQAGSSAGRTDRGVGPTYQ
ncbi:HAMP domain-containing protein [Streptomyces sp. 3MP-14]|uniref:histidine kinase n=1 Tax=Streptomyces mimosae TaxID=2586635 RepID=A0A5N6AED8_9ACTN|nr:MULTISPECIES: nitrate- and nitrite sensing domain-containing protein [Streptomyces]KAB8165888.1 HAMP domain-containing protein [Streptomyces mimosae]KAB8176277.1 HAMP domain-containing protein [Streptomyces sp. 3MP-14]